MALSLRLNALKQLLKKLKIEIKHSRYLNKAYVFVYLLKFLIFIYIIIQIKLSIIQLSVLYRSAVGR